jgi:hypothetical protein
MKNLLTKIKNFINSNNTYQSGLEYYIQSKRPTNTAEVEMLVKQYGDRMARGYL